MVVPRFVSQALRDLPITIFGDGNQTRCFCYVGDVVDGLVALGGNPGAFGRVFNLGGTEEISIRSLAERVVSLSNSKSQLEYISYDMAYEEGFEDMQRRVPDTTRARDLVGFDPQVGLDEIILTVIADQQG